MREYLLETRKSYQERLAHTEEEKAEKMKTLTDKAQDKQIAKNREAKTLNNK